MTKEVVEKLAGLCCSYDPFTQYIDNYRQEQQAVANNKKLNEEFNEIMQKHGIDYKSGVLTQYRTSDISFEKARDIIVKWLSEMGVTIEETKEKQEKKREWTSDEIKTLVQINDKVLYGALRHLYACQTADEKVNKEANHKNGMGFNGADAPILTSLCEFLEKTGFLTPKQKGIARKKLVKYTKQLTMLANA